MKRLLLVISICIGLVVNAQTNDSIANAVYAQCDKLLHTISVHQGVEVQWNALDSIFLPDALLSVVGVRNGKSFVYDLGIKQFKAIDTYTKNGFEEHATAREIWTTPHIALVKETYEATVEKTGKVEAGINFYTFVYIKDQWLIKTLSFEAFE